MTEQEMKETMTALACCADSSCAGCPLIVCAPDCSDPCDLVLADYLLDLLPAYPGEESDRFCTIIRECLSCSSASCDEDCPVFADFGEDHQHEFFARVHAYLKRRIPDAP